MDFALCAFRNVNLSSLPLWGKAKTGLHGLLNKCGFCSCVALSKPIVLFLQACLIKIYLFFQQRLVFFETPVFHHDLFNFVYHRVVCSDKRQWFLCSFMFLPFKSRLSWVKGDLRQGTFYKFLWIPSCLKASFKVCKALFKEIFQAVRLIASNLIKPLFTPGGWHEVKWIYWKVSVGL